MIASDPFLAALAAILATGAVAWLASLWLRDVSFVDSLWSLFFLLAAGVYAAFASEQSAAAWLAMALLAIWALRLSLHITVRNWGEPEDARYQQIRENNQPAFWFKSLYIVFGLQGLLAFIISVPLFYAVTYGGELTWLHGIATAVWVTGFIFEAGGDWQLMRFRQRRDSKRQVLDSGLWRYTRHPNYFGDACVWWGYWLFAAAAGAWWTVFAPLLMTFLIVRVSGVAMLEKDIGDRRPEYADYIRRTSAFIPMPPKAKEGN